MDNASRHEWISAQELVRRTSGGISLSLVYRLCREGALEAEKVSPGKWLVRADAFDLLREKRRAAGDRDSTRDSAA